MFFMHLQLEGESISRQDGRESFLQAGDFTLCDSTRRYDIVFTGANRMLVLGIPNSSCVVKWVVRNVSPPSRCRAGTARAALCRSSCANYWREYHRSLDEQTCSRVAVAILDLIGAAYADLPQALADRSSMGTAHRIRIINYIEAHLSDPDLTPTRIAEACRMTTRYLHHLFSEQDETVARYICAADWRRAPARSNRGQRGRTVTAIAFDYGFNSPTHFGRVFRAKYNVTPREYRREHSGPG